MSMEKKIKERNYGDSIHTSASPVMSDEGSQATKMPRLFASCYAAIKAKVAIRSDTSD